MRYEDFVFEDFRKAKADLQVTVGRLMGILDFIEDCLKPINSDSLRNGKKPIKAKEVKNGKARK